MIKKIYLYLPIFLFYFSFSASAGGGLIAFYKLGSIKGNIKEVKTKIIHQLESNDFEILGSYSPMNNTDLQVIIFTNKQLENICQQIPDRGLMAAGMRVGLIAKNDSIEISLLNPEYIFYAYLRDYTKQFEIELNQISIDIKMALYPISNGFFPYITSSLSERELKEFRFTVRNPSFEEPVLIKQFSGFEEAVKTINENLQARKEGCIKVYELIDSAKQTAVFGVGLLDERRGETVFLPKLGISHIAALPYELAVSKGKVTILHGKYRFPLYWSDLTITEYRKIYKSPRDVEELMKALTH
ncbi:MAG: hypothetical protein L3J74_04620 [Bacteroidales bacterium]|nr:hypothetical protein [Bacteroidales bacterium]